MSVQETMADARRFPRLEPPFAIVGAAGGFLSVRLLSNPLVDCLPPGMEPLATMTAIVVATIMGFVMRRVCIGRRYAYLLEEPAATARASGDSDGVHAIITLVAGAIVGAVVVAALDVRYGAAIGAIGGGACALVFLPVVIAVLRAARAAQRGRLGTLVAHTDRRAVWSILATALALTTLEALPDWWASAHRAELAPTVAVALASACGAVVLAVLLADVRSRRAVRGVLADLSPAAAFSDEAAVIDLGLGDDVGARVARGVSAYRDRDRTLALVRGDPFEVRSATDRAIRRGHASAALVSFVLGAHALAALVAHARLG